MRKTIEKLKIANYVKLCYNIICKLKTTDKKTGGF